MTHYKKIKLNNGSTIDQHRLIASELVGPLDFNTVVHHKDGDKTNNDPDNLELMSRSDHSRLHTLGIKHTPARRLAAIRLSWEERALVDQLLYDGYSYRSIARRLGVTHKVISNYHKLTSDERKG